MNVIHNAVSIDEVCEWTSRMKIVRDDLNLWEHGWNSAIEHIVENLKDRR